jgi:hypothetical protein
MFVVQKAAGFELHKLCARSLSAAAKFLHSGGRMTAKKRKVSCTFKRENTLEIQERIYRLPALRQRRKFKE